MRRARSFNNRHDDISSNLKLSHRVVLAPVTRCRALNYVQFYSERATPGVTEAVAVTQAGIGFPHSPGIWSEEQIEAWGKVVAAVHKKGDLIFCQLWHVGRASHTYYQPDGCMPVSSTARRLPKEMSIRLPEGAMAEYSQPRALQIDDIALIVEDFRQAARNARRAGFDGVEIHAGHGYLVDQFFKDGINDRTDAYGGSIENRCRFGLEVVGAVASMMGEECTAIRISPVIDHLDATDSDPDALGLHLISQLNKKKLAYLHMTEPRFNNKGDNGLQNTHENCLLFSEAYNGVVMLSGGFTREMGMEAIRSGAADLVSYGRLFISNADLPLRFAIEAKLNAYDHATFYTHDQVVGILGLPQAELQGGEPGVDQEEGCHISPQTGYTPKLTNMWECTLQSTYPLRISASPCFLSAHACVGLSHGLLKLEHAANLISLARRELINKRLPAHKYWAYDMLNPFLPLNFPLDY